MRYILFVLMCLIGIVAIVYAQSPDNVYSTGDEVLYNAYRTETILVGYGIDSGWDSTLVMASAGYSNAVIVNDLLGSSDYNLRIVGVEVTDDTHVTLFGDGINCRYPSADTLGQFITAGSTLNRELSDCDSLRVWVDNANTTVYLRLATYRTKSMAP